ncbi:MAG: tyrosine-type recombinase/integrase [Desulfuromonadales bacterium]
MSRKKIVFTDTMIKNLKPKIKKYFESEGNGFTIRVTPSDTKTFLYLYSVNGKRREMNLGIYPYVTLETARGKFQEAQKQVKNCIDPLAVEEAKAEEEAKAFTVGMLIEEYIEKYSKPRKRTWGEDKRILDKDVLTSWGKRKAADIKKRDIVLLLEAIVKRGAPGGANNTFKIIRKMFNFAVARDILEHTPCAGVEMPAPLNKRDRYLSENEIRIFWHALDTCHVSDNIRSTLRLILLTGQRPGEIIGMHTKEIDDTGRWWTIPVERSKNKREHRVYLTDTALELIGNTSDMGFLFRCPRDGKNQSISNISIAYVIRRNFASPVRIKGKDVYDKTGKPITENLLGVDFFTPHDLRRTCATHMSEIGVHDETIDAVLNHKKQGVIGTYNRNRYDKEKQGALEAW